MKTKKILALALAAVLLVAVSVAGTVAYLTAESGPVENTFVPSDIDVEIKEHKYNDETFELTDEWTTTNSNYQFVPGVDLPKDPTVTVTNDVDCYVFLTVTETNWPSWATYTIDGWTKLEDGVWYKAVGANDAVKTFNVIANKTITVPTDVDVDDMAELYEDGQPKDIKLVFNAYACQQAPAFDPATAWETYLGK